MCSLDLWLIKRGSGCFEGGGDSRVVTIASPRFRANFGCDTAGSDSSVQLRAIESCFESDAKAVFRQSAKNFCDGILLI